MTDPHTNAPAGNAPRPPAQRAPSPRRAADGWQLLARNDGAAAETAFKAQAQRFPQLADPRVGLAVVALRRSQPQEALDWLDQAFRLAPSVPPRWRLLQAKALEDSGNDAQAEDAYAQVMGGSAVDDAARHQFASFLRKNGRQREALGVLAAADAASFQCHLLSQLCKVDLWMIDDALAQYANGVAIVQNVGHLGSLLGLAARLVGKGEEYARLVREVAQRKAELRLQAWQLDAGIRFALGDREGYLKVMEPVESPPRVFADLRNALLGRAQPRRKVFGIGLARTGTTSYSAALRMLGWRSEHWVNPVTSHMLDASDAPLYDAICDGWPADNFEWLAARFPDALFVLNERNPAGWSRSIDSHYRRRHTVASLAEMRAKIEDPGLRCPYGEAWRQMHRNLYTRHGSNEAAWAAHEARVDAFFGSQPGRLLRLSVDHPDPWKPLCAFLGVPVPARPYPHLNVASAPRNT